jgi:hypothetical protein
MACCAAVTEHKQPLAEKDILCLGHLKRVFDLLDGLAEVGCERDTAGNRELFFNDYCKLVLLHVWNPVIDSLRRLQEATGLDNVAKALGVKRFSLGSFSESPRVFDPRQLLGIIKELSLQLQPVGRDPRLSEVRHAITLVDSTVLRGLGRLTRIAALQTRCIIAKDGHEVHGFRLHTQLELGTFAPCHLTRTGARNAGEQRESNVLAQNLAADRCYVGDGGYDKHCLLDKIVDHKSSFVIRLHEDAVFEVVEERPLSPEAKKAKGVRDAIVQLPGGRHRVRIVEVAVEPHPRRSRKGTRISDKLVLVTSLTDLPAELVALIYSCRYSIELYFRIFKQLLGLRHLLSQCEEGVDIQVYCTVIVCLLVCLISGRPPNKSNVNMVGWYLLGLASQEELLRHLNRPDNTGVKLRAKAELWKKLGY